MQHVKYKIIGITISIILYSIDEYNYLFDCKERVKERKTNTKKLGVFVDIIMDKNN